MQRAFRRDDRPVHICEPAHEEGGNRRHDVMIGLEKRDYMGMLFSAHDMATQDLVREALDPDGFANPLKVLPSGSRCSDSFGQHVPEGAWV